MQKILIEALDSATDPVLIVASDHTCHFFNRALAAFLGIATDGQDFRGLADAWPTLGSIVLEPGEVVVPVKGGRKEALPVTVKIDRLQAGFWLLRPQIEIEVKSPLFDFHAERLQTLGMLAGGVAHDFNNILAGILGHTTYLNTILPGEGAHCNSLRAVEDGAKKASTIIQQILNFSRLDSVETIVPCDLGLIAKHASTLLRGAIPPDFRLHLNLPDQAVTVLGGEARIAQVVVNLVVNARDALGRAGDIWISISKAKPKKALLENSAPVMGMLEVRDNGQGMTAQVLQRAFEPFFSTKREQGTGLGLATVHAIVEQFSGEIDVASKVNEGTTFSIYFPLAAENQQHLGHAIAVIDDGKPIISRQGERILIVDDESPVRNVLSLSLEHLGYQVALASSGSEAIERYEQAGERYDLVILDMLMPVLSGEEVFFRLKSIDQNLQALIISGYSSEEAVQRVLDCGGRGFIQKPFTINELSRKVRECLQ